MEAASVDAAPLCEAALGPFVADVALTHPTLHNASMTVGEARAFFLDDHVHMALVVEQGRLLTAVERGDLDDGIPADAAVLSVGSLGGRTIRPELPLPEAARLMDRLGRRRLAVTTEKGELVGLLCRKTNGPGFCSDDDVRGRRRPQGHRRRTGILLVGGESTRFGSPKALARVGGETFAERAWRLLGESCDRRLAVGKAADGLELPFEIMDDGTGVRAPLAGIVAGLQAADTDLCLVVPVDCPSLTPADLERLVDGCDGHDAAVPQTGPLPGAYRRSALPVLAGRLALGRLKLRDALAELAVAEVELPARALQNVNSKADLVPYATARAQVTRFPGGEEPDLVAVEEPLELRIDGEPVAVTMRTPGHDEELALGFAVGEGLAPRSAWIPADLEANAVELQVGSFDPGRLKRHFYTSSSCGVCGKGALAAVAVTAPPSTSRLEVPAGLLASLPDLLRRAQPTFELTGGLHAAGLFAVSGALLCVREDVGRHNAVDKVVGWAFREGRLPLEGSLLCVSGRLSFELVQKAACAGVPVLVGVGAPSSLAVELAAAQQITLCGFARNGRVNVYSCTERVTKQPCGARAAPSAGGPNTPGLVRSRARP
jgi:FdhD protein